MPSPLESFDTLPNSAFIRLSTVTALFACSASTIWRGASKPAACPDRLSILIGHLLGMLARSGRCYRKNW